MKGSKRSKTEANAPSRLRASVRTLLGKAVHRVQGTIRAWLGHNRPDAIRAQMPVTSSSTKKMLRANERLAGWHGVLRWKHHSSRFSNIMRRYRQEPNPADLFFQTIADRYRLVELLPFTSALPLTHPLGPIVPSSRSVSRLGTFTIARTPFPSGREEMRKAKHPHPDPPPFTKKREQGREHPSPALKAREPFKGMLEPGKAPFMPSREEVRDVEHLTLTVKVGEPSTGMLRHARSPLLPSRQPVQKPEHPSSALKAREPFTGMLRRARSTLSPSRQPVQKLEHPSPALKVGEPSTGMLRHARSPWPPSRQPVQKLEHPSPALEAARELFKGMLRHARSTLPPSRQPVQKMEHRSPALKARGPFKGVLRPVEAPSPRAESARRHRVSKGFMVKPQPTGPNAANIVPHDPEPAPTRPADRGLTDQLTNKGLALALAAPTAGELATVEVGALREKPRTSFERTLTRHPFAKEEAQQAPIQGREMPIRSSVQRRKRGLARFSNERSTDLDWVQGKAVSLKMSKAVSIPQTVRPTMRGLLTALPPVSDERSTAQAERVYPAPRPPIGQRPTLRGAAQGEDIRLHLVQLGWRFKPRIGSSLKDPRLLSKAPLQLRQEMGPGKPLAPGPRKMMERILGEDFGHVRVHSEPAAARAAADLKAEAFTVGRDIFFGSEKAKLDTPSGRALLGHELTHVSQRRGTHRMVSTSILQAQAEEREALSNELTLRQMFQADQPLAPWPVRLTMSLPGPLTSESTTRGVSVGASPTQALPAMRYSGPSMELAKAPIGRPTPAESPTPPAPASAAEPPTPERRERELDVDGLARQVYDLIMRRLTVERERVGYR